jgi:hypothetical membrane protein
MQRWATWRTRWGIVIAVTLTAVSMLVYPGGTFRDESSRGYSFTHNFLSDLGNTVAFNYEGNRAGAVLFGAAALVGVLSLAACIVATVRLLAHAPAARPFARLAAGVSVVTCVAFLVVGLVPSDKAWELHSIAGKLAFRSLPVTSALLAIATLRDPRFRRRAAAGWAALTLVLVGIITAAILGPKPDTDSGLVTQVVMQKIMVTAILVAMWVESGEAARVRAGLVACVPRPQA